MLLCSSQCLSLADVCDGVFHCPDGDDERMCNIYCPPGCQCQGLFLSCQEFEVSFNREQKVTKPLMLVIHTTTLKTFQQLSNPHFSLLEILDMSNCRLHEIPSSVRQLIKLRKINFSHNNLTIMPPNTFENVPWVTELDLKQNAMMSILNSAFRGLVNLARLNLSHQRLRFIDDDGFVEGRVLR